MKNFKIDTKDCIELLYARRVLKNFPAYGVFWERFIGNRTVSPLKPYGLRIPKALSTRKKLITDTYREITYSHYTLFCQLAGAHFQLEQLKKSLKYKNPWLKHFCHWESFELFYSHLGNVMNQVYHLWELFFSLSGLSAGKTTRKKLESFINLKRKKYLLNAIARIDKNIVILRNNIVHYARGVHLPLSDGAYSIPLITRVAIPWERHAKYRQFYETRKKCQNDLRLLERTINQLHEVLINEISAYLITQKIRIRHN